jgi:hypothetical protein
MWLEVRLISKFQLCSKVTEDFEQKSRNLPLKFSQAGKSCPDFEFRWVFTAIFIVRAQKLENKQIAEKI